MLEIRRIHADGLVASNAKLEARFSDLSRRLLVFGAEVEQGNSPAREIVASITEAIRRTQGPSLFDPAWYLGQNPDVAAAGIDPLEHYLESGSDEGRNPNRTLRCCVYLAKNPDVAAAELNPLEHYCEWGVTDGRDPSPLFSTSWYLAQNPDVAAAGLNPLAHYLKHGASEGRDPHPLFDTNWYLAQNPEVHGAKPSGALFTVGLPPQAQPASAVRCEVVSGTARRHRRPQNRSPPALPRLWLPRRSRSSSSL